MTRTILFAILLATLPALAQSPTPTLDDDDRLALVMLSALNDRAKKDCDALDATKAYLTMRQRVEARLKVKHGMTIDQAVQRLTETTK